MILIFSHDSIFSRDSIFVFLFLFCLVTVSLFLDSLSAPNDRTRRDSNSQHILSDISQETSSTQVEDKQCLVVTGAPGASEDTSTRLCSHRGSADAGGSARNHYATIEMMFRGYQLQIMILRVCVCILNICM